MRHLILATIAVLSLSLEPAIALAKGGTPQNHHCMKDGAELTGKTHKQCTKEGGKWEKLPAEAGKGDAAKTGDKSGDQPTPKPEGK
jgi:hypothetical protein